MRETHREVSNAELNTCAMRPDLMRHTQYLRWIAVLSALWAGCIYDTGDRCRNGRIYTDGLCVCPAGTTEMKEECVIKTVAPGGLGDPCDASKPCASDRFSECHIVADGAGYCTTTSCSTDADCGGDYSCASEGSATYCKRAPRGLEKACTSQADCEGLDASYCAITPFSSNCAIPKCSLSGSDCPSGYSCMDFSAFMPGIPTLCVKPL